jgi:Protein of unknown function (DUF3237)
MSDVFTPSRRRVALLLSAALVGSLASAQQAPLGTTPAPAAQPRVEFVFEERVTLAPAVVLGETAVGHRQYIPITGGTIAGPKLQGEVIPGGWDFQLRYANGCGSLTADYFLRAADGTIIHILNEGFSCFGEPGAQRSFTRPRFEAPKGPHDWLTRGTFVATLELEPPAVAPPPGTPPKLEAIRIKVYQIK